MKMKWRKDEEGIPKEKPKNLVMTLAEAKVVEGGFPTDDENCWLVLTALMSRDRKRRWYEMQILRRSWPLALVGRKHRWRCSDLNLSNYSTMLLDLALQRLSQSIKWRVTTPWMDWLSMPLVKSILGRRWLAGVWEKEVVQFNVTWGVHILILNLVRMWSCD